MIKPTTSGNGGEQGQVSLVLLVACVAAAALGLALLQVADATAVRGEAQTAADAAALAAVDAASSGASLGAGGAVDIGPAGSAAAHAATANDATLRNVTGGRVAGQPFAWQRLRYEVTVESGASTSDGLISGLGGGTATETAAAEVRIDLIEAPRLACCASFSALEAMVGLPVLPHSALRVRTGQTCVTGVDTDRLVDDVAVAIIRAEAHNALLGLLSPVPLTQGALADAACRPAGSPPWTAAARGEEIRIDPALEVWWQPALEAAGFTRAAAGVYVISTSPTLGGPPVRIEVSDPRLVDPNLGGMPDP